MTSRILISSLAALLTLALASCGGQTDPAPQENTTTVDTGAKGDVLPGSISDAMLPLDTVTSTAPPAADVTGDTEGDRPDDALDDGLDDTAADGTTGDDGQVPVETPRD